MYGRGAGQPKRPGPLSGHAPGTQPRGRMHRKSRFSLRTLRLVTGLTLFTYVGTHLLNHSLGNVSIAAMEAGLLIQKWIWQGALGTAALYFALATHFIL